MKNSYKNFNNIKNLRVNRCIAESSFVIIIETQFE